MEPRAAPLSLPTLASLPCTRPRPVPRDMERTVRLLLCPVRAACAPALRRMERLRKQNEWDVLDLSYTLFLPNLSQAVWWVLGVPRDEDVLDHASPKEGWHAGPPPALAPLFARQSQWNVPVAHVTEPRTNFDDRISFMAEVKGPELHAFKEDSENEIHLVMQAVFEKEVSHFSTTCVEPLVRRWQAAARTA